MISGHPACIHDNFPHDSIPPRQFPTRHFPNDSFLHDSFPLDDFQLDNFPPDSFPKDSFPPRQFPTRYFPRRQLPTRHIPISTVFHYDNFPQRHFLTIWYFPFQNHIKSLVSEKCFRIICRLHHTFILYDRKWILGY